MYIDLVIRWRCLYKVFTNNLIFFWKLEGYDDRVWVLCMSFALWCAVLNGWKWFLHFWIYHPKMLFDSMSISNTSSKKIISHRFTSRAPPPLSLMVVPNAFNNFILSPPSSSHLFVIFIGLYKLETHLSVIMQLYTFVCRYIILLVNLGLPWRTSTLCYKSRCNLPRTHLLPANKNLKKKSSFPSPCQPITMHVIYTRHNSHEKRHNRKLPTTPVSLPSVCS